MRPGHERWGLHVTLAAGLSICALGVAVELHRGLDGHLPAWVYVLEWPLFAIGGAVVWWRLWHDEDPAEGPDVEPPRSDDPELESWREYVARLDSGDTTDPR